MSIDNSFDKYVADNVSYGCEEDIEDIKRWISEEGEDAQVALYYAQHEGAYVFNDFDIYVEGMDFTYDKLIIDMGLILMPFFCIKWYKKSTILQRSCDMVLFYLYIFGE